MKHDEINAATTKLEKDKLIFTKVKQDLDQKLKDFVEKKKSLETRDAELKREQIEFANERSVVRKESNDVVTIRRTLENVSFCL